jgi:hypothetical protein
MHSCLSVKLMLALLVAPGLLCSAAPSDAQTDAHSVAAAPTSLSSASPEQSGFRATEVRDAGHAWQSWVLNCQGCHRADGLGSEGTDTTLAATVAKFLHAPGGREYLIRVPGVATSELSDADLAELINWMLLRFDREHVPASFQPYTPAEVGRLRTRPLRLEAKRIRERLLRGADGK